MAPISSTWALSQERCIKSGAKVMINAAKRAGRSGMAVSLGGNVARLAHPLASSTRSDQIAQLTKVELRACLKRPDWRPLIKGEPWPSGPVAELFKSKGLVKAFIVDDAVDEVPQFSDLSGVADEWALFAADLEERHRKLIDAACPLPGVRFDDESVDDSYVAAVWKRRGKLDGLADPVFELYDASQRTDMAYVDRLKARLEALGLDCTTRGRAFAHEVLSADIIVIDLYLGPAQNKDAFDLSKRLQRVRLRSPSVPTCPGE